MSSRYTSIPRLVAVAASIALLAGCGDHAAHRAVAAKPTMPRALAERLASISDLVVRKLATGDSCGALAAANDLQGRAITAVADGQVPRPLQNSLVRSTAEIASRIQCIATAPPPRGHGHGEHGKGKHKGHGGEGD